MFPASSVARTSKMRLPWVKPASSTGLVQEAKPPPSSWHSKVRLAGSLWLSVPEKTKMAVVLLVGSSGPLVMLAAGSVRSTQVVVTGFEV